MTSDDARRARPEATPADDGAEDLVDSLFERFLAESERGETSSIDSFAAKHPESGDRLRKLHAQWSKLDDALPEPIAEESFFHADGAATTARARRWSEGQRVGDYRLVRLLGRGGMGEVWEAEEEALHRRVALKLMRSGRPDTLLREARAAGRVTHPNIVAIHAAGEADGVPYVAQQFVAGGFDLAQFLARMREAPSLPPTYWPRIASLFAEVAEAVEAAHQAGVVHRDLKPQNILIDEDDRPHVSDFGLAQLSEEAAREPGLAGTWPYMSPEQVRSRPADRRSDVFALGAVLYEALTLRRAFEGDTGPQIAERILESDPTDPRQLRSQCPRDLAVICTKALSKAPDARYPTMRAFAEDLRRFLADEPIHARPAGPFARAVKWSRRHPAKSTAIALVSVALGVIALLLVREVDLRRSAEADRAQAERQSYLANIRAASLHLERGDHVEARRRLRACPPALRAWEWHHAALRADTTRLTLYGHDDAVASVALSPDGRRVVTGSLDGSARVWDASNGALVASFERHSGPVRSVAISGDGRRVVSGGDDAVVRVWDSTSGAVLADGPVHYATVLSVATSDDGRRIISGSDDGTARFWDGRAGVEAASVEERRFNVSVVSVGMSADGTRMVTGSRYGTVRVWDGDSPEEITRLTWYDRDDVVVTISRDGSLVISGADDGTLRLWDAETGEQRRVIDAHDSAVTAVTLSGDGRRLASASFNGETVELWDVATGASVATLTGAEARVTSLAISADGDTIVAGCADGTARVWDGPCAGAVVDFDGLGVALTAVAADRDGSRIALASVLGREPTVVDGRRAAEVARLVGHDGGVLAVALSTDGSTVATASVDGSARVWDTTDGTERARFVGHRIGPSSIALDAAGEVAVTGSYDHTVALWDTATGERLGAADLHDGDVTSVAISADGARVASAAQDGTLMIWDVATDARRRLDTGVRLGDAVVALDQAGERLACASLRHDTILLYDARTGERLAQLAGPRRGIQALTFGPGPQHLVTTSPGERAVRLWDLRGRELVAMLDAGGEQPTCIATTADGRRLIAGTQSGRVLTWESDRETACGLWLARGLASDTQDAITPDMNETTTPAVGGFTDAEWNAAVSWSDYLAQLGTKQDIWTANAERAAIDDDVAARLADLPGPRRVLVLTEDWCGDAARSVPVLAKAFESTGQIDARYLAVDDHPDALSRNLTHGGRSIPLVLVQDADGTFLGLWGPRPAPLQALFRQHRAERGPPTQENMAEFYGPIMAWYGKDRGVTTLQEVLMLLERGGEPR